MSDKRDRNNYSSWKYCNEGRLRVGYDEWMDKNYTPVQPDTYQSFDDYCMGQWQCRETM